MQSYEKDGTSISYTYDANGMRAAKRVNGVKTEYLYLDGALRYEKRGADEYIYTYDANGHLANIKWYRPDDKPMINIYVITNLQGDVVGLYDYLGVIQVSYEYDAWGNTVSITDKTNGLWSGLNPFRYRGYYYDTDTGLYYLGSRYYNPEIGRFLNADSLIDNRGIVTQNLFQYCANNPIINSDPYGHLFGSLLGLGIVVVALAILGGCSVSKNSSTTSPSIESTTPATPNVPSYYEKSYAATVYAEAGGENKRTKQAVAHVMNNRVGTQSSWTDIESVISADNQFDGYKSSMYQAAMNYYNDGVCDNLIDKSSMDECLSIVIPIYNGTEPDITGGALYFHSFPNPSDWAYNDYYTQVYVSGTENFWFYK